MRQALFVVAWIALILPWQHCHSDCQDRVVLSATAGHACHSDHGPVPCGDRHEEADHDRADFSSLAPIVSTKIVLVMARVGVETFDSAEPRDRIGTIVFVPLIVPRPPATQTVVLLL